MQMVLDGVVILHKSNSKGRLLLLKHAAWTAHGAKVTTSEQKATHIVVGPNVKDTQTNAQAPVVNEDWPASCIEAGQLLPTSAFAIVADSSLKVATPEPKPSVAATRASRQGAFSLDAKTMRCYNQDIIDFFYLLAEQRSSAGKEFSHRAYKQAIASIEDLPIKLTSVEQAVQLLPSVFKGKIRASLEMVLEGRIDETILKSMREKSQVIALFTSAIYGIGAKRANDLYNAGHRTLDDVLKHTKDPRMIASIEHSSEMLQRISRKEVETHFKLITEHVKALDSDAETMCMGSYRRQKVDCGDIDIIITKKGASKRSVRELMRSTVESLFKSKLATFTFGEGEMRWLGATSLPEAQCWRRVDLLAVPYEELGAAFCYYTGSDMFNRYMRFRAMQLGLQLNESGLYKRESNLLIESRDERKIFECLSIRWTEPEDRQPENFIVEDTA